MSIADIFRTRKKEKEAEVREEQRKFLDELKTVPVTIEDDDKDPRDIVHSGYMARLDGQRPFLVGVPAEDMLREPGLYKRVQREMTIGSVVGALAYAHRDDPEFIKALEKSGLQIVWEK